ncbi:MAG TPA: hypothetical protein VFR31_11060, partial [Thermoanaerobaculia bacterium]|nr:hypothetical protein [Thermoanaerobaculia bacterium]
MSSKLEEALMGSDMRDPEQIAPDPGQQLLHRAPLDALRLAVFFDRRRQSPAVHLARARQRQAWQHYEGGRHHIVRKPCAEERPQVALRRRGSGYQIPDQTAVSRPVLTHDHHTLAHSGIASQRR